MWKAKLTKEDFSRFTELAEKGCTGYAFGLLISRFKWLKGKHHLEHDRISRKKAPQRRKIPKTVETLG